MARFDFKEFWIDDAGCGMKLGSDSVLLGAWFLPQMSRAAIVADAGAGSGVLSLMAAQMCPEAQVLAVELNGAAASAASANFAASRWGHRLQCLCGDFCTADLPDGIDAVISNPPYFTNGLTAPDSARAGARHQDTLTFPTLMRRSASLLAPGGHLGFISPADVEADVIFEAEMAGLKLRRLCRVITAQGKKPRRLLWDFSPADGSCNESVLCLRNADGTPSEAYRRLVEPFYIKIS